MSDKAEFAAAKIRSSSELIEMLELVRHDLNTPLNSSPLANFRDAIQHFVRLAENTDAEHTAAHSLAIDEHLARGIKDVLLSICLVLMFRLTYLLHNNNTIMFAQLSERGEFLSLIESYQDLKVQLRNNFGSYEIDEYNKVIDAIKANITATKLLLKKYNLSHLFLERFERIKR